MRSRVITLLLWLSAMLPTQVGATWYCEGRQCGVTPLYCCCTDPSGSRDSLCLTSPRQAYGEGACSTPCGCTMVASGDRGARALVRPLVGAAGFLALPPATFALAARALPEPPAIRTDLGADPPSSPPVVPLGLRAPPPA